MRSAGRLHRSLSPVAMVVVVLAVLWPCPSTWAQGDAAKTVTAASGVVTLQQRLDRLSDQLEQQRESLNIPGMAIAVVKDDKVVLLRGFGVRDVERNLPVTADTLFAIGSSTKAFTATLAGMMVDQGRIAWDDPVSKHLPNFRLHDEDANARVKVRDLMCHRTGLARTDLPWISGRASRGRILEVIGQAEPMSPFGEKFHYNNIMFLAAGEACAAAGGQSWDELVYNRLLTPLGMSSSTTLHAKALKHAELARGYHWDKDEHRYQRQMFRNLDSIAPAGAINSSARDMANWVRFLLADGIWNGHRLISQEQLHETWKPHIAMTETPGGGEGIQYGLGWMVHDWNKRRLIEHGGNIDGFGAQVAFLPDDGVGFVLLTNVTATPLQAMSIGLVFDALLGDWKTDAPPLDVNEVANLLGSYRFDVLKTDVTVLIQNGKLAVDVPGQTVFALKPPDDRGRRAFEMTDTIVVWFNSNDAGDVVSMTMEQNGVTMELPRAGVEMPLLIAPDESARYLGAYHAAEMNLDMTVLVHNGRLAVDVPGQMIYHLHAPDAEGHWVCREVPTIRVRFEQDETGSVTGMRLLQPGVDMLMPRVEGHGGAATSVPTLKEVSDARRAAGPEQVAHLGGVLMKGTVRFVQQGVAGVFEARVDGPTRVAMTLDMAEFGMIRMGMDGDAGASDTNFGLFQPLSGRELSTVRAQHPLLLVGPWEGVFKAVRPLRRENAADGTERLVVELELSDDYSTTVWLDPATGTVERELTSQWAEGLGSVPTRIEYSDYRDVQGVLLPHRAVMHSDFAGSVEYVMETVEVGQVFEAGMFIVHSDDEPLR